MGRVADLMGWMAHDGSVARRRERPAGRPAARLALVRTRRIIRLSGVTGAPVFSVCGERCGRICDLSLDKRTGHLVYALVAVEGHLGFLQRVCPVPWDLLRYDAAKGGYVAPAARRDLAAGPPITAEELRHMGAGEAAWQQRLEVFYNPYPALPFS